MDLCSVELYCWCAGVAKLQMQLCEEHTYNPTSVETGVEACIEACVVMNDDDPLWIPDKTT